MSLLRAAQLAAVGGILLVPTLVRAQTTPQLPPVTVTAPPPGPQVPPVSRDIERFAVPATVESIDRRKIDETVNIVDSEDALKYLPSLLLRKRNYGDNQPTLATRTWGINSSARNLVYVDDIPISALIGNNNTIGAPRWGLISPEEIQGIDMIYGPFSAAYPGNSIGGVVLMSTRMPETTEFTFKQTEAVQTFDYYSTTDTYTTANTAATAGSKVGNLSFFLAANRQESFSQPLSFVTTTGFPTGTKGTIAALNKSGVTTNVVGAGGLLHTTQTNYKAKFALDVNDWLKATYMVGLWDNLSFSTVQSYLRTNDGSPTFGSVAGFASATNNLYERHLMNAFSLKSDTKGTWDAELVATYYTYLDSIQRGPAGVTTGVNFTTNGTIARMDGTGWQTQDAKLIWRPGGTDGAHEASGGVHHSLYLLNNPTWNALNWLNSPNTGSGVLSTFGGGKTETWAAWLQDAWRFAPGWKLTLGGRYEWWTAYDGFNLAGNITTVQPVVNTSRFSPKATLGWQIDPAWSTKLSFGKAVRYPTVAELYQVVSTGTTFAVPNPNLSPEEALSFEWAIERQDKTSRVRLSLFAEDTANALISQTSPLNGSLVTTFQNVGLTRNLGFELMGELKDVLIPGLSLSNSVTFVDSKIMSNPNFQSAFGSYSNGMWVPYVPQWRDTAQAVYKPNDELSFALSARYQGKMYTTLDNSDYVQGVYGSFDPFFVMDAKVRYQLHKALSFELGVDNLTDAKYFEFHPFPGRTYLASLKVKL